MSKPFFFAIMTPEKDVAGGECDFLVVPTTEGELGVLADHAPLLARIASGELRIYRGEEIKKISVGSGLLEVRDNTARLLVFGV